ncbi:hypothetical protein RTCIAT899_PC01200 (plasmid) [Rhizobium tropici CIAT 899]|nr:hypothetical protein RTCIAT899_PC01200 [Rhizobium tropici CIAT 899]
MLSHCATAMAPIVIMTIGSSKSHVPCPAQDSARVIHILRNSLARIGSSVRMRDMCRLRGKAFASAPSRKIVA